MCLAMQGLCTTEHCPYAHVKVDPSAPVCQEFVSGYCPRGVACTKKHLTPRMIRQLRQSKALQVSLCLSVIGDGFLCDKAFVVKSFVQKMWKDQQHCAGWPCAMPHLHVMVLPSQQWLAVDALLPSSLGAICIVSSCEKPSRRKCIHNVISCAASAQCGADGRCCVSIIFCRKCALLCRAIRA